MSTWARTATNDMLLPAIGQGATAIITDPVQCAAIRIQDGLQMWLGSWALDLSEGFPWQSVVGKKNPSLIAISNELRAAIILLGAPIVTAVTQLNMAFFSTSRDLKYGFRAATAVDGVTILGGSSGPAGQPFVVVD